MSPQPIRMPKKSPAPGGSPLTARVKRGNRGRKAIATGAHPQINQSLAILAGHPVHRLQLADLMRATGLSRRGFFKAFRKQTGSSPGQVLRQKRIEQAKRLLVECDMGLEEIAAQCGYRSVNTFWVAFRAETGLAPKRYQRQAWLNNYKAFQVDRKSGNGRNSRASQAVSMQ